ncbi:hypothetical protein MAA_00399 [Metarhizium robertsii ARSEF 23]|uniref:Uncharacterized protein n=1 Tax=Metarhizium robertsii (strain ARSEF 23 / ATCC MYA-3075) TaxID=655844 RepID=E9EJ48_METRA|nr:uncharacterized protein MAA_00399 [Metarhizium robertsii ARSEF 23]EFZ03325.2 hypothetical protein MAA_00399 [Metarhizium robertsii ARSEF 23]
MLGKQPTYRTWPVDVSPNGKERQIYDFLRCEAVKQVAGYFDTSFWTVDVLRATQAYPAIWHASLAMAAMQNWATFNGDTEASRQTRLDLYQLSLRQYNASIKYLRIITPKSYPTYSEQETILLASALFARLCCLNGDISQALSHAHAGIRLFYEWEFWKQEDLLPASRQNCILAVDSLLVLFTHLENRFVSRLGRMDRPRWRLLATPQRCSRKPFGSANEAYCNLMRIVRGPGQETPYLKTPLGIMGPLPPLSLGFNFRHEIDIWKRNFDTFRKSKASQADNANTILILQIIMSTMEPYLFPSRTGKPAQDAWQSSYEHIVDLAEQLLNRNDRNEAQLPYPKYSFFTSH